MMLRNMYRCGAVIAVAVVAFGCSDSSSSSAGTGGASGTGGGAALGSGGSSTASGGGVSLPAGTATFSVSVSTSSAIPTVGIVEWSVDTAIESARVDFGRDASSFEYSAPVDLAAPNYRTLLLGMKPNTTYSLRVVAQGGGMEYTSEVQTVQTGFLPNALPPITVRNVNAAAVYGGFTESCNGVGTGLPGSNSGSTWAFIIDRDGDYVWAYDLSDTPAAGCSRARMSFDGKHMWAGNFSNVSTDGALVRVPMDGLGQKDDYSFPGRHHDFTVLPNNNILFYEQANGGGYSADNTEGPDIIRELNPETREVTDIYHENTDFSEQIAQSGAHTNQIRWVPHLNAISFSLRHTSTIGVISYPDGELITVFGGPKSDYDVSWDIQHGHQLLENTLLVFNNNGSNGGSSILEFQYDMTTHTAAEVLNYSSGQSSMAFGDVQRLPNGNTFITYSTTGVFHELDVNGTLVREMTTDPLGYAEHRKTLYGPPPPVGE